MMGNSKELKYRQAAPDGLDEQMTVPMDTALSTLLAALSESAAHTPGPATTAAVSALEKIVAAGEQSSPVLREKQRRLLEVLKSGRRPDDSVT